MPPYDAATPVARQIWDLGATTAKTHMPHCTPFNLPAGGVLTLNQSLVVTLTRNAQFSPVCSGAAIATDGANISNSTVVNLRDPFYASIAPQLYAIATATVISYLLVIILFITPGTFFANGARRGNAGRGNGFLSRRGMISGSYGSSSVVGVGRRPWLQKVAALSVAVSLTIATADTFRYAEQQYNNGYSNALELVQDVAAGVEIRVVQVISDTFLWLALVQTLIRLFPRHKEKVTIKWLGFALISFDTVFSILNNFVYQSAKSRPRRFSDAIPALSYLFELAIGLIYASCVIYYSLIKRRFAFWHRKMRNICLVAFLGMAAVLVPIVFFVLDVANSDLAGWGDYIRWVGAAAASVVVWEWVERIEALERDERKDGVLGREIFDGDEMVEFTPSEEITWPGRHHDQSNDEGRGFGSAGGSGGGLRSRMPFHSRPAEDTSNPDANRALSMLVNARHPSAPLQAVTPVSRTDTSSASTIYQVRRIAYPSPSPQLVEAVEHEGNLLPKEIPSDQSDATIGSAAPAEDEDRQHGPLPLSSQATAPPPPSRDLVPLWRTVQNPFKRKRALPPAEVAGAQSTDESAASTPTKTKAGQSMKSRLGGIRVARNRRSEANGRGEAETSDLPVTVIPAQPRGQRTWSPDDLRDPVLDECNEAEVEAEVHALEREHAQVPFAPNSSVVHPPPTVRPDLPITIIPAPSRGQRAWSPQDLEGPSRSTTTSPQSISSLNQLPNGTLVSRRGTLMISENEQRNAAGARRSLYSRTSPLSMRSTPESATGNGGSPVDISQDRPLEAQNQPLEDEMAHDATHAAQQQPGDIGDGPGSST